MVDELTPADRQWALARLSVMLSQNQLQHSIGARFPLAQMARAHQTVEAGQTVGNVVVDLSARPIFSPGSRRLPLVGQRAADAHIFF
jgi:hypothetical protein